MRHAKELLKSRNIVLGGPLSQCSPATSAEPRLQPPLLISGTDKHDCRRTIVAEGIDEWSWSFGSTVYCLYALVDADEVAWMVGQELELEETGSNGASKAGAHATDELKSST
jgi:hypothetical protein